MIKLKDGYAKLIGTTYTGSADRLLLSNGGDKAVGDFAASSHNHSAGNITSGTLPVARGGTGATTFTSGAALIGNGTGAITTRSITSSATSGSTALITSGGVYTALSGKMTASPTSIELNNSGSLKNYGGFIDFHFHDESGTPLDASGNATSNGKTPDYTSRIIEDAAGRISVNGVKFKGNQVTASGGFVGDVTGNSATATKLKTARTIALTGSVTGSGTFDGSGNLSISTTTNHTHAYAGASSAGGTANAAYEWKEVLLSNGVSLADYYSPGNIYYAGGSNNITDLPEDVDAFGMYNIRCASGWFGQILLSSNKAQGLYYRVGTTTGYTNGLNWKTVLDSSNYTSYTVKKDGTGASGNWGINITGNATTATKLATSRTFNLSTGVTATAQSFDGSANVVIPVTGIKEAYLTWGGQNFSGSYGPIDAALIPQLGANRFAFMPAESVTVEYSTNGGSTWSTYSVNDNNKINLFNGNGTALYIGASSATKIDKSKYMLRVTIATSAASVYTVLNKFIIYCSTSGSSGAYCTITARLQSNYTAGTDTWVTFANKVPISGWSGYNVINTGSLTTYGNTASSQYGQVRFTFGVTSHASSVTYPGLTINKIFGFGGVGWTTPSTMASTGVMYTYDASKNVTFPAKVTAISFTGNVTGNVSGSSGSCTGNAASATKLGSSNVGTSDRPIYLSSGSPIQTTYRMVGTNATATAAVAIDSATNTGIWYVNGTSDILSQSDGVAIVNKYNDNWITQIYQDYRTGKIAVRGKNNGTWQAWKTVAYTTDIPTDTNYYHTRVYSSGLKISTGTGVSDMYVPEGTTSSLGAVKQHKAENCTSYTSDDGATTPAAVKKAVGMFGVLSGYGTCSTAAATAAKVISIADTNWRLVTGCIIGVKFTNSNSASSVTLNVNSTGAKNIWYNNAKYTSTSTSICGYKDRVIYYMYDGTYWVWLNMGSLDGNSYAYVRQYQTDSTNEEYPLLFRYETSDPDSYVTKYTRYDSAITVNPSTNTITATTFAGNATTASKLAAARTISLTGSVTGSGSFDGSGNLSIATTTNHTHSYVPYGTVTFTPANTELTNSEVLSLTGAWSMKKGTWNYAGNGYIVAGDFGNIDLAGTSVLTFGNSSAYTQLFITAPTQSGHSGITNEMLFYNDHGSDYSPGWTRVLTDRNYESYVNTTNFPGLNKTGTVTSVATGTGLTGGTIYSTGTISINSTYQTYISNGNTAYGWGNHADAGYLDEHQTIYALKINNSAGTTQVTYTPNSAAKSINLTKAMVGLGNVDNTADANKTVAVANKLGTETIGGSTTPIYLKSGTPNACTYSLNATVNSGMSGRLAYYSGIHEVSNYISTMGSSDKPVYLNLGTVTECSTYAGGTAVTLNGTSKATLTATFYAPTSAGTRGYLLKSNDSGAPTWTNTIGSSTTSLSASYITSMYADALYIKSYYTTSGDIYISGFTTVPDSTSRVRLYTARYAIIKNNSNSSTCAIYAPGGFYESSDERLKCILNPIKVDLDAISKLRKIYYTWKDEPNGNRQLGVIAQDVQDLYPELVDVNKDTGYLSLAYDKLSVIALAAVDELHKTLKEVKEENKRLRELVKQLETKLIN